MSIIHKKKLNFYWHSVILVITQFAGTKDKPQMKISILQVKTRIVNSFIDLIKILRIKLQIWCSLYKWEVTWNFAYSPFNSVLFCLKMFISIRAGNFRLVDIGINTCPLFFLISRLNIACCPHEFDLQIN